MQSTERALQNKMNMLPCILKAVKYEKTTKTVPRRRLKGSDDIFDTWLMFRVGYLA